MYSIDPTFPTPDQTQLSRRAAQRYADLSAVRNQRAKRRAAARRPRSVPVRRTPLALDAVTDRPK